MQELEKNKKTNAMKKQLRKTDFDRTISPSFFEIFNKSVIKREREREYEIERDLSDTTK